MYLLVGYWEPRMKKFGQEWASYAIGTITRSGNLKTLHVPSQVFIQVALIF